MNLTDEEQAAYWRTYATDLRATASAYITAANAAGMDRNKARRDTADYLISEANRLIREARLWKRRADEVTDAPDPEAVTANDPDDRYGYGQLADEQAAERSATR